MANILSIGSWPNVKERFKKITNYHVEVPEELKKYLDAKISGRISKPSHCDSFLTE